MFNNHYDVGVTTFSPEGRLLQVEYSMEAVKRGSAAIGLRSKSHVVLAAVNRAPNSKLITSYQKKICKVEDQIGVAIAGLAADGRSLLQYMQSESHLPVARLVVSLANNAQVSFL